MNKLLCVTIFLVIGCALLVSAVEKRTAEEATATASASAEVGDAKKKTILNKTLNGINKVADKGAQVVHSTTSGIESRAEKFVSSQRESPNIIYSAIKGAGSLLKNYTLEAGQFVRTVGGGVVDLAKHTTAATGKAVRKSVHRVAGCPRCPKEPQRAESGSGTVLPLSSSHSTDKAENPSKETAQAPEELVNNEKSNAKAHHAES